MRPVVLILLLGTLAACAQVERLVERVRGRPAPAPDAPVLVEPAPVLVPAERIAPPATVVPLPGGAAADALDTTTEAERVAAAEADPQAAEVELGREVASLGDPTDPGFWVETSLVTEPRPGRITDASGGGSALVELRPAGPGGARVSLPALRVIGAPLTDLPELVVYGR